MAGPHWKIRESAAGDLEFVDTFTPGDHRYVFGRSILHKPQSHEPPIGTKKLTILKVGSWEFVESTEKHLALYCSGKLSRLFRFSLDVDSGCVGYGNQKNQEVHTGDYIFGDASGSWTIHEHNGTLCFGTNIQGYRKPRPLHIFFPASNNVRDPQQSAYIGLHMGEYEPPLPEEEIQ